MYFYCYDYVFPLYVYVWLSWLRVLRAFSSVTRQMPGSNPQRRGTASTLPIFCVVLRIFELFYVFLCCSMYCLFCVVLCIFCACVCVLNYCHQVATQLQLNIISYHIYHIIYHIISIISYHIAYIISYLTTPYYIISYMIAYHISYHIISYHIIKLKLVWS